MSSNTSVSPNTVIIEQLTREKAIAETLADRLSLAIALASSCQELQRRIKDLEDAAAKKPAVQNPLGEEPPKA